MKTRAQSSNQVWVLARKECQTASKHYEVLTKINTVTHKKSIIEPKANPLILKLLNRSNLSNIYARKKGRDHQDALKSFYFQEAMNDTDHKINCCGLFVDKNKPYIAAYPDGMFSCKGHEGYVIEIKCPFKLRDQFIKEGINDCDFLEILDRKIHLKKSHKYHTQLLVKWLQQVQGSLMSLFGH